jgi:hypothetical protein
MQGEIGWRGGGGGAGAPERTAGKLRRSAPTGHNMGEKSQERTWKSRVLGLAAAVMCRR